MSIQWKGVFPAVTTKFTADDKLDFEMFETNIQAQLEAGVDGIILGGTLGEASSLQEDEKNILVKRTVEIVNGKVPVVMNIAEQNYKSCHSRHHTGGKKRCFRIDDASSYAL